MTDNMSPHQTLIAEQAQQLLDTLHQTVPGNVAHFAVENARRALGLLIETAGSIRTRDMLAETWTVTVVDPLGATATTVHGSEADALAALRANYAADDDVADEALVSFVESQGEEVHIEYHRPS